MCVAPQHIGNEIYLADQRIKIGFEPLPFARLARVAPAVETDFLAERDVDVERNGAARIAKSLGKMGG